LSAGGSPQRPEFVKLCFQRPAGIEVVLIFYYKCFRKKTAAVHLLEFVVDPVRWIPLTSDIILPVLTQEGWIIRDNIHCQASFVFACSWSCCRELRLPSEISIIKLLLFPPGSNRGRNSRIEIKGLCDIDKPVEVWSCFTRIPPHPGSYSSAL